MRHVFLLAKDTRDFKRLSSESALSQTMLLFFSFFFLPFISRYEASLGNYQLYSRRRVRKCDDAATIEKEINSKNTISRYYKKKNMEVYASSLPSPLLGSPMSKRTIFKLSLLIYIIGKSHPEKLYFFLLK